MQSCGLQRVFNLPKDDDYFKPKRINRREHTENFPESETECSVFSIQYSVFSIQYSVLSAFVASLRFIGFVQITRFAPSECPPTVSVEETLIMPQHHPDLGQ